MTRLTGAFGVLLTCALAGCGGSGDASTSGPGSTGSVAPPPKSAQPARFSAQQVSLASCVAAWNTAGPSEWRDLALLVSRGTVPTPAGKLARSVLGMRLDDAGNCIMAVRYGKDAGIPDARRFTYAAGDPITDATQVQDVPPSASEGPAPDFAPIHILDDGQAEFSGTSWEQLNTLVAPAETTYTAAVASAASASGGDGATPPAAGSGQSGSGVNGITGEEVFSTSDRLERCYAHADGSSPAEINCIGLPSEKTVTLVAGSGATYDGRLAGGNFLTGRKMPEGTRRMIVGAFRCDASWRGIRCKDVTGSGEGFIIGDRVVILTADGREVSRH
jgi:hypothetical protein